MEYIYGTDNVLTFSRDKVWPTHKKIIILNTTGQQCLIFVSFEVSVFEIILTDVKSWVFKIIIIIYTAITYKKYIYNMQVLKEIKLITLILCFYSGNFFQSYSSVSFYYRGVGYIYYS